MSAPEVNVVVGGGQAAGRAIQAMRQIGFAGRIELISRETHLPYERPPLSKEFLLDRTRASMKWVLDERFYSENDVSVHLGKNVSEIERANQRVACSDGTRIAYDRLLLATGSRLRCLSIEGADKPNVFYLRTIEDSLAIGAFMKPAARLLVIGGGLIGLEVAACARQCGCEVTLVESGPQVLGRVACREVSRYVTQYHRAKGIEILTDVHPLRVHGHLAATSFELSDGRFVATDFAVVGIGVIPETQLAEQAGLAAGDGIHTDEYCASADPAIFAAGDAANQFSRILGRRIRLECWQNAQDQGRAAGQGMAGRPTLCAEVPWAWSDQCDLNIQIAGHRIASDEVVLRGDVDGGSFTAFSLRDAKLTAATTVNRGRDMVLIRRMLSTGRSFDKSALADERVSLRKLLGP